MKVTQVNYGMQRPALIQSGISKTANDRVVVTVSLDDGDSPEDAIQLARAQCVAGLAASNDQELQRRLQAVLADDKRRACLVRFLSEQ